MIKGKDEMSQRVRFNYDLLTQCIERDKATIDAKLYNKHTKLNRDCVINGVCHCGNEFSKSFKSVYLKGGMFCERCVANERGVSYDIKLLRECSERDEAKLDLSIYNDAIKLSRESIIHFICQCNKPCSKNFRAIYEYRGMFCEQCVAKERGILYDLKLLNECAKRDEAKLDISVYNDTIKLSRNSTINFICNCKTPYSKMFRCIYEKGGMFCEKCTAIYRIKRYEQNCEEKYGEGISNPSQVEEIKEKSKQTLLLKTGVEHSMKNPVSKRKKIQTCLDRYKSEHPMQNSDIAKNASKKAYKLKEYTMPSGEIRNFQGYEIFGMDMLLKTYQEDDIVTCRSEVPELWYSFKDKDTRYRHYVDFYIPSVRKCVEVKSMWTYECNEDKVLAKQAAAKKEGYRYEIWIFDNKNNLIKKIE